jgi:predicted RNA binding protein YcfA (HicA-like mRNA interferase family)
MPKLKVVSAKQLLKKLHQAGFVKTHQRGSHWYLKNITNGRIVTVPVHGGNGDIPVGTLYNIVVRQAGLGIEEFNKR